MAALLKKRALAEYSQVIQEEPKPPAKKLRLMHKPKSPEPHLDIQSTASSYDAFQSLLRFQECLPVSSEHLESTLQVLLDHYKREKEGFVRAKVAALLGELAKTPGFNAALLVEDMIAMVGSEISHKALSQLVGALITIGRSRPQDVKLHKRLVQVAKENLSDNSHLVRCKAMELIGALGSPDQTTSENALPTHWNLQSLLGEHAHDIDPRVRSSSFEAMLKWHERGLRLSASLYNKVCEALADDYEGVRLAAVKLVWVLSQLYPENIVPSRDSHEDIRLVDDGFARICHMVNDLVVRVRAEAVGLLGSLHLVSPRFLEQTLDKKLMSNMRRKKSAHERQKDNFQSGEWSSGKKWADDAPKEEVNPDTQSLISSGACGAFVHGLEDEFLEVRNAAIDSLCELAKQSSSFAIQSQDFLVDMFNDEIESVRLNAINSLQKISNHLTLREDQLEIIIGVLRDFSYEMRLALRDMLCGIRLGTKTCLNDCMMALLDNLRRYPEDRSSIWRCMCSMGKNHPALVLPLASDYLNNHPYFDTPEPDMDDPAYISVLLMVLNAAPYCPTMPTLFLEHTVRHYTYLRDSIPDYVPDLKALGKLWKDVSTNRVKLAQLLTAHVNSAPSGDGKKPSFMAQTLQCLNQLLTADSTSAQQLMEIIIKDLGRVPEVEPAEAATAECYSMYLQCQVCLIKLLAGHQWQSAAIVPTQQKAQSQSQIDKVLRLTEHMECLFVGLSTLDVAAIRQIRLRAHTLQLLSKLQSRVAADARTACIHYLQTISQLQMLLKSHSLEADTFTAAVLSSMHRLESCEPQVFLSVLQSVVDKHHPVVLKLTTRVKQAGATVIDTPASDSVIKFTAGLTASVPLVADLENIENIQNIRIQVKYPDQERQLIIPRTAHFKQLSPLRFRLATSVLLSHGTWSESCHTELSIVMCYNPDRAIQSDKPEHSRLDHAACSSTVELGKAIKVLVAPKRAKH